DLRRKGKKDFDAASLRAACESEDLVGETKERPVAFGVKSFEHSIDRLEDRCSEVLNLVPAFHDRFIQDDADWSASLYPRLQTFLTEAARSHEHLRLALDAPTTLAFAAGAVLDVKSGRDIELEQRTSSREVWRLDTQTPDAEWPRFNPVLVELGQQAPDIAVAVGLTHDIRADVRTYVDSNLPSAGRILNCMLPSGAGPASVRNRAHAALLAHQLAQAVSETRVPGVARTVHLFMAAPNGFFSFLAGQRRALMGRVTLYEFDFGQAQSGSYMPSLTLPLAAAPSAAIALTPR
ncbi:SAVED domain-containing protein, partial [Xanthomonas hortorum]